MKRKKTTTTKKVGSCLQVAYLNVSRRLREEKGVEYGFDAGQPPHKVSLVIPILGQAERLHFYLFNKIVFPLFFMLVCV